MKMKISIFTISILLNFFVLKNSFSQKISLLNNSITSYKIVADKESKSFQAALVLSQYIKQVSGNALQVVPDTETPVKYEIVVGYNKHAARLNLNIDTNSVDDDGYIMKTTGNTLFLYGKNGEGIFNCVYSFLEQYLKCKVLASDAKDIPVKRDIEIPAINEVYNPPINYRDLYYKDTYDSLYTAWNKIDHFNAGGQNRLWGEIWSSSFRTVLPPKNYFDKHPEFFALNTKGQRHPDQLDLTNEAMFNEYVKRFTELMKRFPNSKIWSVAANDAGTPNYCRCQNCEAVNKKEGTPMGTLLNFVNRMAAKFPDKIIATQAYLWYEEPPKNVKPAANVMIVECGPYYLNRAQPYQTATDAAAVTFRRRLNTWLKITPNLRVWDYVIDYRHLMCPFPNFQILQPNMQYFASLGIKDIFMQGNISTGGEFAELRAFLIAKLLWDPNINFNVTMNHFLSNYYGDAGPIIRKYIDLTTSELIKSKIPLISQDHPHKHFKGFLAPNLLVSYNKIFDEAEKAVQDDAEKLERVKGARLPLIYAMLEISKMVNLTAKGKAINTAIGYDPNKNILDLLDYFVAMCKKHNIQKLAEYPTTVDSYKTEFTKYVINQFK